MTDRSGRTFDGDSILGDNTANCGDSLQPGLIASYKMRFKAPASAKPAYITLWDSDSDEGADGGQAWSVR
jgi:hypothetical protein